MGKPDFYFCSTPNEELITETAVHTPDAIHKIQLILKHFRLDYLNILISTAMIIAWPYSLQ